MISISFKKKINCLFSDSKSLLLPANVNPEVAANNIGNYFVQKVNDIYDHLAQKNAIFTVYPDDAVADNNTPLLHFKELTMDEVTEVINKTSKKGCSSASHVLQFLDNLSPIIATMLNLSLRTGHFVDSWKEAFVTPLLKKCGLEFAYNNLRPISNLSYISKLVETVADQLNCYYDEIFIFFFQNVKFRCKLREITMNRVRP